MDRSNLLNSNSINNNFFLSQLAALANSNLASNSTRSTDSNQRLNLVELAAAAQLAATLQNQHQQYSTQLQLNNTNQHNNKSK